MPRRRSLRSWPAVLVVGMSAALSCEGDHAPRRGQVMVELWTDMSIPKDLTHIRLEVRAEGAVRYEYDFQLAPDGRFHLPGTLAVVEGSEPNTTVSVQAVGLLIEGGRRTARTFAKATTTVPRERIVLLRLPVQWLCDGSAVDLGEDDYETTCQPIDGKETACRAGSCEPVDVDEADLPDFDPRLVFGGGATPEDAEARCFDTLACMQSGTNVVPEADCTLSVPDDGSPLNFALRTAPGGAGICPEGDASAECYVPLNQSELFGWTLRAGARGERVVVLPSGVCVALDEGRAVGLTLSTACPTKTDAIPACGEWSQIETPNTNDPVGAGGDGGIPPGASGGATGSGSGGQPGSGGAEPVAGAGGAEASGGSAGEQGSGGAPEAGSGQGGQPGAGGAEPASGAGGMSGAEGGGSAGEPGAGGAPEAGSGQGGASEGGSTAGEAGSGGGGDGGTGIGESGGSVSTGGVVVVGGVSSGGAGTGGTSSGGTSLGGTSSGGTSTGGDIGTAGEISVTGGAAN